MDIADLLEEIETLDPSTQEKVRALVTAILAFHREGLEHMLTLTEPEKIRAFVKNEAIAALLALHDLEPHDQKSRAFSQLLLEEEKLNLIPISQLTRHSKRASQKADAPQTDVCDLCGAPIDLEHPHLVDPSSRGVQCACRACSILFSGAQTKLTKKLVTPKRERLSHGIPKATWDTLGIPVDLAFFWESSAQGRVVAAYPGPAGAVESSLSLERWSEITNVAALPALAPDVEAVVVNKTRGADETWVVSIDRCYALIGAIRGSWRGMTGGEEVQRAIASAFEASHV